MTGTTRMTARRALLAGLIAAWATGAVAARAATLVVDGSAPNAADSNSGAADRPFKTINAAAQVVEPGDTVLVKPGVYREAVRLTRSGTAQRPIQFVADPEGSVVLTGADPITTWEKLPGDAPLYQTKWDHLFEIDRRPDGTPVENHPGDEPRWGRAEQVIADGRQLIPQVSLAELRKDWDAHRKARPGANSVPPPLPNLGGPFAGEFAVDTKAKTLTVWFADVSDPSSHRMEASTRGAIFGLSPWENPDGVRHVQVRGFTFRYAATFPQRAAIWLQGADNVLENCVIEGMAGNGVEVAGVMRRCIVRDCGNGGGGAIADGFRNEECLWEGNAWKPLNRGWDSAGFKLSMVDGGVFRRCLFRRNGGPGLWFDIHVRNVLVDECVFQENELSGVFIEISRDITVRHCLAVGNATNVVGSGAKEWGAAGIMLGESENCVLAFNTCVGNKDGITFREQGPRPLPTPDFGEIPYHIRNNVVVGNVLANNRGYALGLWYDNGFFGPHPSEKDKYPTAADFDKYQKTISDRVYDPMKQGLTFDRNLVFGPADKPLFLYGVEWRDKHRTFTTLADWTRATGFDAGSRQADPQFVNAAQGNYRFRPDSPAWALQAGWPLAPTNIEAWAAAFLPTFGRARTP